MSTYVSKRISNVFLYCENIVNYRVLDNLFVIQNEHRVNTKSQVFSTLM